MTQDRQKSIEPQNLRLQDGRIVADLQTVAACDDALTELRVSVAILTSQIEDGRTDAATDPEWLRRAIVALRMKKAAVAAVVDKRERLSREARGDDQPTSNQRLIRTFRQMFPTEFSRCLDVVKSDRNARYL